MSEQSTDDLLTEATRIANQMQVLFAGQTTAGCQIAIAMVLGAAETYAKRPDLCGTMERISAVAHSEMERILKARLS